MLHDDIYNYINSIHNYIIAMYGPTWEQNTLH